jgi:hypothetical protein
MSNLDISLTKAQADFLALTCPFPLFVAGLGSGKSYLMGLAAVLAAHQSSNCLIGIYEPSHELTRLVSMPNVIMWLDKMGYVAGDNGDYKINKNDHTIESRNPRFGNFLFKSYDNPDLLIGYETSTAFVDEIDTLPTDKAQIVWDKIVSRNRQQLKGVLPEYTQWSDQNQKYEYINRTMAFTSPEGFKFCYGQWVQKAKDNSSYQKVHGKTRDNPAISEAYIKERTKTLTQAQVKAYLEGEFVNLTSGTVYDCYNRETHRSYETITGTETLYIGMDFNVRNMCATVYVRRNGHEWHAVDYIAGARDTPDMINIITTRWKDNGHHIVVYPDASKPTSTTNASITDISLLQDAGFTIKAKSKNPEVRDRVSATNRAFTNMLLFVNDELCPPVADCLEQQTYDKNGKPDKDSGNDHQNDATTYPIVYEMPVRKNLYPINFQWAV